MPVLHSLKIIGLTSSLGILAMAQVRMRVENPTPRSWFLDPLQDAPAGTLARGALNAAPGSPENFSVVRDQVLEIPRFSYVVLEWERPGVDQGTVAFRLRDSSPGNPSLANLMTRWSPGPQGQLPEPERQVFSLGAGGAVVVADFSAVVTRNADTFTIQGETYAAALAAAEGSRTQAPSENGPSPRKRKLEAFQGPGNGTGEEEGAPPRKRPRWEGKNPVPPRGESEAGDLGRRGAGAAGPALPKNPPSGAAGSAGGVPGAGPAAGAGAGAGSTPEAPPRHFHRRLELYNHSGHAWNLTFTSTTATLQVILFGGSGPEADPVQVQPGAGPVKLRLRNRMTARVLPMNPLAFPEAEFEVTRKKHTTAQTFHWASANGVIGRSMPWAQPGADVQPPSVTIDEERALITLRKDAPRGRGAGKNP